MYYRADLARAHHLGFRFHADACAAGILALIEPLLARDGLVVEIGCGSGLLTKALTDAGHRVIATDASPDMLALARDFAPGTIGHQVLALPEDPLPDADAIVSTGHALSYLSDRPTVERALVACAKALRPGGILALDLEDLTWATTHDASATGGWSGDDWALVTRNATDGPDHWARIMAVFTRNEDGTYRRDDERHDNVLIDVAAVVPPVLEAEGLAVDIRRSFGTERNPDGLMVVVARRP